MKRAHLTPGQSARGLVRQANRQSGHNDRVFAIDDDLNIGPLSDDAARSAWWVPLREMYLDGLSGEIPSLEQQWRAIASEIDGMDEIVIWSSDHARDQTHLRFAAAKLREFSGKLSLVHVPMDRGLAGVGMYYPDRLAEFGRQAAPLDQATARSLAQDYLDRLQLNDGVRYQTDEGLEVRDYATFDQTILDACPSEFVNPTKVIGLAMSRCDGRNWAGDMFLRWRLRGLVDAGLVSATGSRWFVDDCDVRVSR